MLSIPPPLIIVICFWGNKTYSNCSIVNLCFSLAMWTTQCIYSNLHKWVDRLKKNLMFHLIITRYFDLIILTNLHIDVFFMWCLVSWNHVPCIFSVCFIVLKTLVPLVSTRSVTGLPSCWVVQMPRFSRWIPDGGVKKPKPVGLDIQVSHEKKNLGWLGYIWDEIFLPRYIGIKFINHYK